MESYNHRNDPVKIAEYQEVLSSYREHIKTLEQLIVLLLTGNLVVIGIAIEREQNELYLLGV